MEKSNKSGAGSRYIVFNYLDSAPGLLEPSKRGSFPACSESVQESVASIPDCVQGGLQPAFRLALHWVVFPSVFLAWI